MAQTFRRTKYWKTTNGKWFAKVGNETKAEAIARYNASPNIGIDNPQGYIRDGVVDSHTIYQIRGWAIDPIDDIVAPTINIWINGVVIARLVCDKARPDVADKYGITGWNIYGFEFGVPLAYQNPTATLRVTLNNREDNFLGTPAALDQLSSTTPATTTATTAMIPLVFVIVDYKQATGLLRYKITGGNGDYINIDFPLLRGTISANQEYSYLFPSGQRNGFAVTGTMSQVGQVVAINFTTGPSIETP